MATKYYTNEDCTSANIKALSPVSKLSILYQTSCSLIHLHGMGFVQLDLKPANIFVDEHFKPCLGDLMTLSHISYKPPLVGTLGYQIPKFEQQIEFANSDTYVSFSWSMIHLHFAKRFLNWLVNMNLYSEY